MGRGNTGLFTYAKMADMGNGAINYYDCFLLQTIGPGYNRYDHFPVIGIVHQMNIDPAADENWQIVFFEDESCNPDKGSATYRLRFALGECLEVTPRK